MNTLLYLILQSAQAWEPIDDYGYAISWPNGNPETTWQFSSSYPSSDLSSTVVNNSLTYAVDEWSKPGCTNFNAAQGSNTTASPNNSSDNVF